MGLNEVELSGLEWRRIKWGEMEWCQVRRDWD